LCEKWLDEHAAAYTTRHRRMIELPNGTRPRVLIKGKRT
jgi:hypothetical protein